MSRESAVHGVVTGPRGIVVVVERVVDVVVVDIVVVLVAVVEDVLDAVVVVDVVGAEGVVVLVVGVVVEVVDAMVLVVVVEHMQTPAPQVQVLPAAPLHVVPSSSSAHSSGMPHSAMGVDWMVLSFGSSVATQTEALPKQSTGMRKAIMVGVTA